MNLESNAKVPVDHLQGLAGARTNFEIEVGLGASAQLFDGQFASVIIKAAQRSNQGTAPAPLFGVSKLERE